MNPASLGNHNQLTAPLLLWCRAAGPWSFLTWLLAMLMVSDQWLVGVVHWIEWLSSTVLLALKTDAGYYRRGIDANRVTWETLCAMHAFLMYGRAVNIPNIRFQWIWNECNSFEWLQMPFLPTGDAVDNIILYFINLTFVVDASHIFSAALESSLQSPVSTLSDQIWNMVTVSPHVPELWHWIKARKVFLKNGVKFTFDVLDITCHQFIILSCQTFLWNVVIISVLILELWPKMFCVVTLLTFDHKI